MAYSALNSIICKRHAAECGLANKCHPNSLARHNYANTSIYAVHSITRQWPMFGLSLLVASPRPPLQILQMPCIIQFTPPDVIFIIGLINYVCMDCPSAASATAAHKTVHKPRPLNPYSSPPRLFRNQLEKF